MCTAHPTHDGYMDTIDGNATTSAEHELAQDAAIMLDSSMKRTMISNASPATFCTYSWSDCQTAPNRLSMSFPVRYCHILLPSQKVVRHKADSASDKVAHVQKFCLDKDQLVSPAVSPSNPRLLLYPLPHNQHFHPVSTKGTIHYCESEVRD